MNKKYTLEGDKDISVESIDIMGGGIIIEDSALGKRISVCLEDVPELIEVLQEIVKENLK